MKKLLKFLFFLSIGLIVFLFVIQKIGLKAIKEAGWLFFGFKGWLILLLTFIVGACAILRWKLILKAQGSSLSFKSLTPLWLIGFSMSYLAPFSFFGGEIFRIYFTKKKLPSVGWKKSIASVAADKILDATAFFAFLIIGLVVFTFYGRFPTSFMGICLILIAGGLLGLLLLFYFKRLQKESALEWLFKVLGVKKEKIFTGNGRVIFEAEKEVFRFFSLKQKGFWQGLSLSFLRYILLFLRCTLLIFFLKGYSGILRSLAVYGFANLATLTPLPANLGVLELGEGFAFKVLGLGFEAGAIFSMVWRGVDLVLSFFGLIFLTKFGMNLAEEKILKLFDRG